jgi:hypothetical protein
VINSRVISFSVLAFTYLSGTGSAVASAQQVKKAFTVAEEIGLTLFSDSQGGRPEVRASPDGNYFTIWSERGDLELNKVEDSLRFYRSQDLENFLQNSDESQSSPPIWIVNRSYTQGRIIDKWQWLADSSGVAYLERTTNGTKRLVLADCHKKTVEPLTSSTEDVGSFDVRDKQHFAYTLVDPVEGKKWNAERFGAGAVVGTGRWLPGLILSDNPLTDERLQRIRHLWAVVGGQPFEVKPDGLTISLDGDLELSPDGKSLITTLPVADVPLSWETLYAPPYPSDPFRIHAGHQDVQKGSSVHRYVRIDLRTGATRALTDGPVSSDAGWWADGNPSWSSDGQAIVLPGVFIAGKDDKPSRPCVAVFELASESFTCVEMLRGEREKDYYAVGYTRFDSGDKNQVQVFFLDPLQKSERGTEYKRTADGTWHVTGRFEGPHEIGQNRIEVFVKQSLNDPPRLIATDKQTSRIIWDPNPQLKGIELGEAIVYSWRDKGGRTWKGGLFKPPDYKEGQRYPLVIQTHGFTESEFRPSGVFPTAFAARALAGVGMVVLQMGPVQAGDQCPVQTPDEDPCVVSGYQAAIKQLLSDGLVDEERVGIIGFSRTCLTVMKVLTSNAFPIKAASITDGVMATYMQSMLTVDFKENLIPKFAQDVIGAPLFGEGLQEWFKRSPSFNLDKVNVPLMVVGEGPGSVIIWVWEPYAGLRLLHKPVELVMLNTDEHVLTNPKVRMASQGGTVDWFRFWLQGYEDPDPRKNEQYMRWRGLKELQVENEKKASQAENLAAPQVN